MTSSARLSIIQCPASIRSYLNGLSTNSAEPVICFSDSATSFAPQIPMVGAEMLGIDDPRPGLTFARYQLRPAVSAPGSDSASISLSMSGLRNPFRNSEKPFREITRSENPRIWKKAMYQDRRPWELVSSARWNARG